MVYIGFQGRIWKKKSHTILPCNVMITHDHSYGAMSTQEHGTIALTALIGGNEKLTKEKCKQYCGTPCINKTFNSQCI